VAHYSALHIIRVRFVGRVVEALPVPLSALPVPMKFWWQGGQELRYSSNIWIRNYDIAVIFGQTFKNKLPKLTISTSILQKFLNKFHPYTTPFHIETLPFALSPCQPNFTGNKLWLEYCFIHHQNSPFGLQFCKIFSTLGRCFLPKPHLRIATFISNLFLFIIPPYQTNLIDNKLWLEYCFINHPKLTIWTSIL